MIDMENSLYIYHMVVPLRYYTYDLHSEKKDSEYVMGLKQDTFPLVYIIRIYFHTPKKQK